MTDLLGLFLLPFDLKDRVVETIRDVSKYSVNKNINNAQIVRFRTFLSDVQDELKTQESIFERIDDVDHPDVKRSRLYIRQSVAQIESLAVQLTEIESQNTSISGQTSPISMQDWFENFQTDLEYLQKKLELLDRSINTLHQIAQETKENQDNQKDQFRIKYMVERNSGNIYLDFEDETSPESLLKEAIFNEHSKTISAVASGMGGVGKTCAICGVALHKNAKARFPDGILYMSLGVEAGKKELVSSLAMFVRETGGREKAIEVGNAETLSSSVKHAAEWFQGRNCLFIIDDISCGRGLDLSVTQVLGRLASHALGKVAFTTRDKMFESDVPVKFEKRGEMRSQKMLLLSAGLDKVPEIPEEVSAMKSVLEMADGLPIALNVIGGRAKYLLSTRKLDHNNIWSTVSRYYEQSGKTFHEEKDALVLNVLMSSIDMIDSQSPENNCPHRLAELCILRKRQVVSVDVLKRMWGLSVAETKMQLEMLERFSMVEISTSQVGDRVEECMGLHDLVLDLSRYLARRQGDCMQETSRRVVDSYITNQFRDGEQGSACSAGQSSTSWYGREAENFRDALLAIDDDGFVLRNIFRLLRSANLFDRGVALLSDPRWLLKQMKKCHWKQVDNDISEMLQMLEEDDVQDENDNAHTFLEMVRSALSESERYIVNSLAEGMFATQIYGRLYHYRSYTGMNAFLERIEHHTDVAWLKSNGAFAAAQPSFAKVLEIDDVRLVRYDDSSIDIVSSDSDKKKFRLSQYSPQEDALRMGVREWALPRRRWMSSNVDVCEDVGLSLDGGTFAAGMGSKVVVFEKSVNTDLGGQSNKDEVNTLGSWHRAKISVLTISQDGRIVVCGNMIGRVVMWQKKKSVWTENLVGTHRGKVRLVCVSGDGKCAVSGSGDRTAVIWKWNGRSWEGHTLQHSEKVCSCAVSKCGSLVVTCAGFGKVFVWSIENGDWQSKELDQYCDVVYAVSEDKNCIVGRNWNDVIVFRRDGDSWEPNVLEGHTNGVTSADVREDKLQVVSASIDGTVRVVDLNRREWRASDWGPHTRIVCAVAVSANRLVSADYNGKVIVWNRSAVCWEKISFEVAGRVENASLSDDGTRLKLEIYKKGFEYYVERDNVWLPDEGADATSVAWTGPPAKLKEEKWPVGLHLKLSLLYRVYEVPGERFFAVALVHAPYFAIVQLMNG